MERKLRDMSWKEFDDYAKTAKTVIIPSGACEVYGLNLPLGSDILVAKAVSELVAEKVNGIVAPCLEIGQSKSLTSFPGTDCDFLRNTPRRLQRDCREFYPTGLQELLCR